MRLASAAAAQTPFTGESTVQQQLLGYSPGHVHQHFVTVDCIQLQLRAGIHIHMASMPFSKLFGKYSHVKTICDSQEHTRLSSYALVIASWYADIQ